MPLPTSIKHAYESVSNVSLDGVEVHHDSSEPGRYGAEAFTAGGRIHLGAGKEKHLGHEAWHAVQQRQGRVRANTNVGGQAANTDRVLEDEADRMAASLPRLMRSLARPPATDDGPATPRIRRKVGGANGQGVARRSDDDGGTRIRRSPARTPGRRSRDVDVMQGVWAGLGPDDEEFALDHPLHALAAWGEANFRQLSSRGLEALGLLLGYVRSGEGNDDAFRQIELFLRRTLSDGLVAYSMRGLFDQVVSQGLLGMVTTDELTGPGGDHEDTPDAPEIPVVLLNLHLVRFDQMRPGDVGAQAIANRLVMMHRELEGYASIPPLAWLPNLQRFVIQRLKMGMRTEEEILRPLADDGGSEDEGVAVGEDGDEGIFQFAHTPNGLSGPKSYTGLNNGFAYVNVLYTRDGVGSIDFAGPTSYTPGGWVNPEQGGTVDLTQGGTATHGLTSGGNLVQLAGGSRKQHFSVANRIVGNGYGQYSPPGLTWHHQLNEYDMVLVDRTAHQKHGHNGGNLYWT
jgi:hypothetical protein